jgi:type IV fimbrial biogenesis protein FimT
MDVRHAKSCSRKDCGLRHFPSFRYSRGLSLIEVITVTALLSISYSIGVPAFAKFLSSEKGIARINDLAASLALTRSVAIKRGRPAVICKSRDGQYCHRRGTTWHDGWIVFVDFDQDRQRSDDEPLVHSQGRGSARQQLTYTAFGSKHYVTYRPSGYTKTNGTFTLCDPRYPDDARALILMKTGRVRASRVKTNGDPLECTDT